MRKVIYENVASQKDAAKRPEVERSLSQNEVAPILKNFAQGKLFYIRTYGCQANVRDEEIMAGYLSKAGFSRTEDPRKANLAIINTCAVRENAEDKVYGEIGSFKANKDQDKNFMLVISGCVMDENDIAQKLMQTYPWITLVIGTHDISKLNELLASSLEKKASIVSVRSFASEVVENMPSVRLNSSQAFVNISYGCDKFCTYCIVPYTRGRERSRKMEDIVKECQDLVDKGYKQITLLGQNVNSYGLDFKDGTTFAKLLKAVAETNIPHLRFLTSYPSQFTDEMIDVMATYPNIDHWLHFPVQSGSSKVLQKMGRRYTREEYLDVVHRIRAKIPDIALTTDIIVGFPYETEEDFQETLSLCKEVGYSSAFTFIYSPRPGTPAAKMEQVPPEVSHERFMRLKALIDELTAKSSDECVGKEFNVLVEGPSKKNKDVLSGYAPNGKLINFPGPSYLSGCTVKVKVNRSQVYSLFGEMVEDPLIAKAKDVAFLLQSSPLIREYLALDKEIQNDTEIHSMGEELVEKKKKLALSISNKEEHLKAKEEYEDLLKRIHNHPLLNNHDALKETVEGELLLVRNLLK
ncbi:MAG: tRNA (N6-isopentenyl adenosine(37)-C2)-methylthiotransferase MiaB [Mollicutes bacterium]|nr:tRNA (N6-isopentenyl adenosine(37)-C2)-methylthiotransferase MiaB [Mollicutes bacterium]